MTFHQKGRVTLRKNFMFVHPMIFLSKAAASIKTVATQRATMMNKSIIYKAYALHRIKLVYFQALLYHILLVHLISSMIPKSQLILPSKTPNLLHRHKNNLMIWDFQTIQYYTEIVLICLDNFMTADYWYFFFRCL